jgi:hypothetical protein
MIKVWNTLISDPDQEIYKAHGYDWWLDNGVKIQKEHNSNKVTIWNCMTQGDNHEPVSKLHKEYFEDYGWHAGMYKVCVDVFKKKFKESEARCKADPENEEIHKRKENIEKKLDYYTELLSSSLSKVKIKLK